MDIPRHWVKAAGECRTRDGRELDVAVWGWGSDRATAGREAAGRLQRLLERIRRGEPFPAAYAYGSRPRREEILETIEGPVERPTVVLTRNRYGAVVLNTTRVLFLDVDLPPVTLAQRLRRLITRPRVDRAEPALARLREVLRRSRPAATFRLYRTAAGFRALATDREFEPAGRDTQELMQAAGADPAFVRLCRAQQSFRARLTPKPWRCGCSLPPGEHPREEDAVQRRFAAWRATYDKSSARYATCRYVETVGSGRLMKGMQAVVALHDRVTRSNESLPLA